MAVRSRSIWVEWDGGIEEEEEGKIKSPASIGGRKWRLHVFFNGDMDSAVPPPFAKSPMFPAWTMEALEGAAKAPLILSFLQDSRMFRDGRR
jgi:hypothetical protein